MDHFEFSTLVSGHQLPFYYSGLTRCCLYYLVEHEIAQQYIPHERLVAYRFDDKALVSLDYQRFSGNFATRTIFINESELNITVYQKNAAPLPPTISAKSYILGEEQTKTIGAYRVYVPCDNDLAINVGAGSFGEHKFKAFFNTEIPSINQPAITTWQVSCKSPLESENNLFSFFIDVTKSPAITNQCSYITNFGMVNNRLMACHWNIFLPCNCYFFNEINTPQVTLDIGDPQYDMAKTLQSLLVDATLFAVTTIETPAVATQARGYWLE